MMTFADSATSKYDLILLTWETDRALGGAFVYSTDLFDGATDQRAGCHPCANDTDHAVGEIGQQDCVAVRQNRRQVKDHHVVASSHRVHHHRHLR